MAKGSQRLFTPERELEICSYYWTRLPSGYYPSYKEVAQEFDCSAPLIKLILRRNNAPRRTQSETRDHRPCKPIHQPNGPAPLCACGCGNPVRWISKDSKWQKYTPGHYSGTERKTVQPTFVHVGRTSGKRMEPKAIPEILTKDVLNDLYCIKFRSIREIAIELNVGHKTVSIAMRKYGIPTRTLSESLILRGSTKGEKNPAWKGGIADWEYSSDWKRICKEIKERDNWTCRDCGEHRASRYLHVHHIDGDKLNNQPDNLISLCAKCHTKVHHTP